MEVSRAYPGQVEHPRRYMVLSAAEAGQMAKQRMEAAPSITAGHRGTVVWYTSEEVRGFVVEVQFERGEADYFLLPCAFEPTFGVDKFDGMLIQDAEAYAVMQRLGWKSDRLAVFGNRDAIATRVYLDEREGGGVQETKVVYATAVGILQPLLLAGVSPERLGTQESERVARAVELLEKVLRSSPQNSSALWFCGRGVLFLGDKPRALEMFMQAAAMDPKQGQFAADAFGVALQLGRAGEAVRMSRQALNGSPGDGEMMTNHALALLISGDVKGAVRVSANAMAAPGGKVIARRVSAICKAVAARKFPVPTDEAGVIRIGMALGV